MHFHSLQFRSRRDDDVVEEVKKTNLNQLSSRERARKIVTQFATIFRVYAPHMTQSSLFVKLHWSLAAR